MNILIEEIKTYLKSWIKDGTPPNIFKDINFNNKIGVARKLIKLVDRKNSISDEIDKSFSNKSITYILGLYLYNDLTISKYRGELDSIRVKEPRIYQFLYKVLKLREDEPKILLSIFDYDIRDIIDENIDRDDYRVELFSTVGLTRLQNQDYLDYLEFNNAILLIVADGVGGGEAGEVASKLAVDYIINDLKKSFDNSKFNHQSILNLLRDTLYLANHKIVEYASEQNITTTIGTTLSLALIVDKINLYIAHIGDSRIYELDNSLEVRQITQDHSVREVLFRSNKITQDEKKEYNKSLLAFTLGKRNLKKENIFTQHSILYNSSRLILCSDGFWEKIDINKETFIKPIDKLQADIYNSIPTDNVTIIRYSPKVSSNIDVDDIYEEYEEEPKKIERQSISYTTNRRFSKGTKITNRLNQLKNIIIILIIISSITFLILNLFTKDEVVKKDNNLTQLRGE